MKQLAVSKQGQQRWTAAQRLEMVERFHQSGLTRKAFAAQEGVARSTLDFWLYVASQRPSPPSVVFREVEVSLPATQPAGWGMEIESANGLKIRCREALGAAELGRLLRDARC